MLSNVFNAVVKKSIKIRYTLIYTFITIFNIFKYDLRLLLIYCEKTYIVIIN